MTALDNAQFEYNELHKKWLIESSEAERVDEQIDKALAGIKATYDNSISNLYTKVLNEYSLAEKEDISDSQFMLYTANEAKKMLVSELYLPSIEAAKDYTKYTSDDWDKFRKIFKQFPAKVNMSGYMVTDEFHYSNENYNPLVLSLNINDEIRIKHHTIEVQDVRTIFDKTLTAQDGTNLIDYWTKQGFCRYVDDKKISDWNTVSRNLFPIEVFQSDNNNILTKSVLVKESQKLNEFVVSPVKDLLNGREAPSISVSENIDHTVAHKIKTDSKQIATNYVLEKLAAAGIEVVTDKKLSPDGERSSQIQFLTQRFTDNGTYDLSILTKERLVKFISSQNNTHVQKMTSSEFNLVFFDKKRSLEWERECKVQFLAQVLPTEGFINNILSKDSFVKFLDSKKQNLADNPPKIDRRQTGNPRYVFNLKSMSNKQNLQLVAVYDDFDKNGDPMILSLRFNKDRKEVEANWVTAVYGKRKNILVDDWTKKGYLVYMNDLELEKAPVEVVTLHMRVSKSASAYESIIKHKSVFVNDMDLVFYTQNNQTYGFAYNGKIYLDPELMNIEVAVHEYTHLWG